VQGNTGHFPEPLLTCAQCPKVLAGHRAVVNIQLHDHPSNCSNDQAQETSKQAGRRTINQASITKDNQDRQTSEQADKHTKRQTKRQVDKTDKTDKMDKAGKQGKQAGGQWAYRESEKARVRLFFFLSARSTFSPLKSFIDFAKKGRK